MGWAVESFSTAHFAFLSSYDFWRICDIINVDKNVRIYDPYGLFVVR